MTTTFTATYSPDSNKLRLTASARLDADTYARVKAAGFAWAPKLEQFIAPMWTPAREDLCIELAGQIDDDDSSLIERAEGRAERFEDYQEKRAAESAAASAYVHRIADGIPFGQPILVGHHSERHARKDAERIENGMRRAVQLFDTAEYWKRRAAGAIAHAKYKERPDVRHRRIKGIESDARKLQKSIDDRAASLARWEKLPGMVGTAKKNDGTPATLYDLALYVSGRESGYASRCYPLADFPRDPPASQYEGQMSLHSALSGHVISGEQAHAQALAMYRPSAHAARWMEHYSNRLAYERAMLDESGGIVADKYDLQPGGTITHRGRRSVILRVNRKDGAALSVSVTGQGWTVGVEEITSYEPPSEAAAAAAAALVKKAPLCNYPGAGFVAITQAQWDEINADSKTTRDMGAGVDATNGGTRHDLLKDYRAGSEVYTRHRVRVASGWNLRRAIGPEAWAAMVAACSAQTCKDSNTAHSYHPVHITDAKTTAPARLDAPPKAPRNSIARKVAEAAGVDTSGTPEAAPAPAVCALTAAKREARAVIADLTQQAPRATYSAPPATQSQAEIEAMRASLKAGVTVVSAPQLFPTPPDLAARMVKAAALFDGCRVLEPSAGTGRLVDAIRDDARTMQGGVSVVAVEVSHALAEGLRAKYERAPEPGELIEVHCRDFLAAPLAIGRFDVVLMNPPFANGADVAHVTKAMEYLQPGGRLVAIMSSGVTFRSDRKTADFRALVERLGGTIEPLPADTFASSGTGVNTVLVVLDAPPPTQSAPPPGDSDALKVAQVAEFMANGCSPAYEAMGAAIVAADPVAPQPELVAEIVHNTLRKRYEWADGRPTLDDFARSAAKLDDIADGVDDDTARGRRQAVDAQMAANYRAAACIVRAEPEPPAMVRGGEGTLYPSRLYKCLAVFLEADPGPANAYMERHPGACVLCVRDGRVYLAHCDDKGTEGAAALLADMMA